MKLNTKLRTDLPRLPEVTDISLHDALVRAFENVYKDLLNVHELPVYTSNAAAITGGLTTGDLYRTNGDPDTVCIVH